MMHSSIIRQEKMNMVMAYLEMFRSFFSDDFSAHSHVSNFTFIM